MRTVSTQTDALIEPRLSDGDHERFAHYVKKSDIVKADVEGVEVEALCGKRWIPNRDPKRYPVCPACREIYASLKSR